MSSSGINLGDAVVFFKGDSSNLRASLRNAESSSKSTFAKIGTAFTKLAKVMTVVGIGGIVAALTAIIKRGGDFQQAITNAASVTGVATEKFEEARETLSDLARALGKETVFSASQAAEALYDLASKGFDVLKMSAAEVKPILDLAAATQTDLGRATEIATATLRGFKMENEELVRVADVFVSAIGQSAANMEKLGAAMPYVAAVANAAGVSLEETVSVLSDLFDVGMDGSMAATSLRRTISALIAPSDELREIMTELALSERDMDIRSQGLTGVLNNLAGAGFTAANAMKVFGERAGPAVIALLGLGDAPDKLKETAEQTEVAAKKGTEYISTLLGQMKASREANEKGREYIKILGEGGVKSDAAKIKISEYAKALLEGGLKSKKAAEEAETYARGLKSVQKNGEPATRASRLLAKELEKLAEEEREVGEGAIELGTKLLEGELSQRQAIKGIQDHMKEVEDWIELAGEAVEATAEYVDKTQDLADRQDRAAEASRKGGKAADDLSVKYYKAGAAAKVAEEQTGTLWGKLKEFASKYEGVMLSIFDMIQPHLETFIEWLTKLVEKVADWLDTEPDLRKYFDTWIEKANAIWEKGGELVKVYTAVSNIIKTVWAIFKKLDEISPTAPPFPGWSPLKPIEDWDLPGEGDIPGRARGGIVKSRLQLVGEQGPEIVSLPRGTQIYPNGQAPPGLGGGTSFGSVTINVNESETPRLTAEAIVDALGEIQRRSLDLGGVGAMA